MSNSSSENFSVSFPWVRSAFRSLRRRHGSYRAMEGVYRDLFVRELARLDIEDRYFPVGAAANHSLLYLVLRCYLELPLQRILDVGAGQTSLLLDALQRKLGKAEIITLEHDAAWTERIAGQVRHQVVQRDLIDMRIGGQTIRMHDTAALKGPFDFIVMDAPPGVRRYSRLGLVHLMQDFMNRAGFVAILDDADRGGEWQTAQACSRWLRESGIQFQHNEVKAAKHQWLFAGGALRHAAYF